MKDKLNENLLALNSFIITSKQLAPKQPVFLNSQSKYLFPTQMTYKTTKAHNNSEKLNLKIRNTPWYLYKRNNKQKTYMKYSHSAYRSSKRTSRSHITNDSKSDASVQTGNICNTKINYKELIFDTSKSHNENYRSWSATKFNGTINRLSNTINHNRMIKALRKYNKSFAIHSKNFNWGKLLKSTSGRFESMHKSERRSYKSYSKNTISEYKHGNRPSDYNLDDRIKDLILEKKIYSSKTSCFEDHLRNADHKTNKSLEIIAIINEKKAPQNHSIFQGYDGMLDMINFKLTK